MIDLNSFHRKLKALGVEFMTGVPDTLLNDFCLLAEASSNKRNHVIAANEGNAVAIAAGYHLSTGTIPLVYMQNSGLGNATNPLLSLSNEEVYAIPMVLLIGWRGNPKINDWAQHKKQGELTPVFLEDMNIPYRVLEDHTNNSIKSAEWAVTTAKKLSSPVALLVNKGVLEKGVKETGSTEHLYNMSREEAIKAVLESMPPDSIFVATTGRATRELHELRRIRGENHTNDFLNVGAMGHASSIATGIALAKKNRPVVCLDGDAAAIMHLGALTTAGVLKPKNLLHILLNNGAHESVGGQPSAGFLVGFTNLAKSAGYRTLGTSVQTKEALQDGIRELLRNNGPAFIDIRIKKGIRDNLPPLEIDHIGLKNDFMSNLK